jgi:hypothetical protein
MKKLIVEKPEVVALIRELLSKGDKENSDIHLRVNTSPKVTLPHRRYVSSNSRKAFLQSSPFDFEINLEEVLSPISQAFDRFVQEYEPACAGNCKCKCHHHDSMQDCTQPGCKCGGFTSDFTIIQNCIDSLCQIAESHFQQNDLNQGLVHMELTLRGFATQLRLIQLPNETSSDGVIPNFPWDYSQEVYSLHSAKFVSEGEKLCHRLAKVILRCDIDQNVKGAVASSIIQWIDDSSAQLKPLIRQIYEAGLDITEGAADSVAKNPLIVRVRIEEFIRRGSYEQCREYASSRGISLQSLNIPCTPNTVYQ